MKRYVILTKEVAASDRGRPDAVTALLAQAAATYRVSVVELEEKAASQLTRDPQVASFAPLMPTRLITPLAGQAPADPGSWGVAAVGADRSGYTGSGVCVAVLDTGIDRSHAAFGAIELVERDFSGTGNGDRLGHGTHCAGTIFGADVDTLRIGVARGVRRVLVGKVLDDDGAGQSDMVFDGLLWAMHEGANIISMSLGFDFPGMVERMVADGWPVDLATSTALEAYRGNLRVFDATMGILRAQASYGLAPLVVAAAGNESRRSLSPDYRIAVSLPAAADGVVSVGAVDRTQAMFSVASFSNSVPVLCAPGVDIASAWLGGKVNVLSGSSMACPHVAGVAALWWEALARTGVRADAQNVHAQLISTARRDVFLPGFDQADHGQGLVAAPS